MTSNHGYRYRVCQAAVAVTLAIVLSLVRPSRVDALYAQVDLESVPVDRLIQNLERLVSQDPGNVQTRYNLARVHAMAFAQKLAPAQPVQIQKGREAEGIWFGYEPAHVPFKAMSTTDSAVLASSRAHLNQAITLYREVIQMKPDNLTARLGYAWCLDQSGDRGQAISAYRQVIVDAWAKEKDVIAKSRGYLTAPVQNTGPVQNTAPVQDAGFTTFSLDFESGLNDSVTFEAVEYLLPLLDREKDKDEIATLQDRVRLIGRVMRRWITPIVIPLGERVRVAELVNHHARVRFDADGTGFKRPWTWITPDAGWLVHAPEKSRPITSGLQMFGSVTFWLFWENGYHALRSLDDNGDGALEGKELEGLALWRDANSNGIAEQDEVKPLGDWGIVSLSCRHEKSTTNPAYVATSPEGVTFADGRTRPTYDVVLYAHNDEPILAD